jgi:NTP pyrophosphatase (non-canonical NTP hydrolase)
VDIETYMREAVRFDNHREELMLASLTHGLMAEAGEVTEAIAMNRLGDPLLCELGDVAWNIARLAGELDIESWWLTEEVEFEPQPHLTPDRALTVVCSRFAGLMEKNGRESGQYRPDVSDLSTALGQAWQTLTHVAAAYGYGMAEVMQRNLAKLHARYAERGLPVRDAS